MNPGVVVDGTNLEVRNLARIQAKLDMNTVFAVAFAAAFQTAFDAALAVAKANGQIPNVGVLTNPYTFTNATPLRTIDVATATPTNALNAIAALVSDLKAAGILPP